MVSRDDIFSIVEELNNAGFDNKDILDNILKYFSTDELKEFLNDYTRLRDTDINWKELEITSSYYDEWLRWQKLMLYLLKLKQDKKQII